MDNEDMLDRMIGSIPCNATAIVGVVHPIVGPCVVIGTIIKFSDVPIFISHVPIPIDTIDSIILRLGQAKQEAMNVQASDDEASRPNQVTEH